MGDVVKLPPKEELVFVCHCGCQVWYIHQGKFECANCGCYSDADGEAKATWKIPPDPEPEKLYKTNLVHIPVDLVIERFRRRFHGDEQIGIIINSDNTLQMYTSHLPIDTERRLKWFKRRLKDIFTLAKEGVNG